MDTEDDDGQSKGHGAWKQMLFPTLGGVFTFLTIMGVQRWHFSVLGDVLTFKGASKNQVSDNLQGVLIKDHDAYLAVASTAEEARGILDYPQPAAGKFALDEFSVDVAQSNLSTNPSYHNKTSSMHDSRKKTIHLLSTGNTFQTVSDGFLSKTCPQSNCELTFGERTFGNADAVVVDVFGSVSSSIRKRLKKLRGEDQILVFFSQTPPRYAHRSILKEYNGVFNLTVSFLRTSDVRLPINKTTSSKKLPIRVARKPQRVVWYPNRCVEHNSKLWKYVEALSKYLDVDVYGKCGNVSCSSDSDIAQCISSIEKKYMFYLSFQDGICEDTVKEYISWPDTDINLVPIVLKTPKGRESAKDVSRMINIADFKEPASLAQLIKRVASKPSEYFRYLKEALSGRPAQDTISNGCAKTLCRLCEILKDPDYHYRSDFDIGTWWTKDVSCVSYKDMEPK